MELAELVSPAIHTDPNVDCPFCKEDKPPEIKTYAGEHNESGVLKANMRIGTAGRSGKDKNCRFRKAIPRPKPKLAIEHGSDRQTFSFQAHHAISGNQAMKGEGIEDWIDKDKGKIAEHTGYSINNPMNGVWLPSKINKKSWDSFDREQQRSLAYLAMRETRSQWHLGHHCINPTAADESDLANARVVFDRLTSGDLNNYFRVTHEPAPAVDLEDGDEEDDADATPNEKGTYDNWLKENLKKIEDHVGGCRPKCEDAPEDNGLPYVNNVVNDTLDRLSRVTYKNLKDPGQWPDWNRFISLLAWEYATLAGDSLAPSNPRDLSA